MNAGEKMIDKYKFRLKELRMTNFMSVEYGRIKFSNIDEEYNEVEAVLGSSVTGIYGINGSGKTTVVKAVETFLYAIWIRHNKEAYLNVPFINRKKEEESFGITSIVRNGCDYASLSFTFHILDDEKPTHKFLTYFFSFRMNPTMDIFDEKITLIDSDDRKEMIFSSEKFLINKGYAESFLNNITKNKDNEKIKNLVEAHSELGQKRKNRFLLYQLISTIGEDSVSSDIGKMLVAFRHEMCANLIPISDIQISNIRGKKGYFLLTYSISHTTAKTSSFCFFSGEDGKIFFESDGNPSREELDGLERTINGINQVLNVILKDTQLVVLHENGSYYLKIRKDNEIVISYSDESYGVRKIIVLIPYLSLLFVKPGMILVIDEFDEGLFEYLLGKILKVIKEGAQGQLIFTAHNLRPLEILPRDCLRFAITNESNMKNVKNRYRKLAKTNSSSNLREVYYRSICNKNTSEDSFVE